MNAREALNRIEKQNYDTEYIFSMTDEFDVAKAVDAIESARREDIATVRAALDRLEAIEKRARHKRLELECKIENRQAELAKHKMEISEAYQMEDDITEFEREIELLKHILTGEGEGK